VKHPCSNNGEPRYLTTEVIFGSVLPRKSLVVNYRELLVKKNSQRKNGSYCHFFLFFFVLIHYGIDVYALVSC